MSSNFFIICACWWFGSITEFGKNIFFNGHVISLSVIPFNFIRELQLETFPTFLIGGTIMHLLKDLNMAVKLKNMAPKFKIINLTEIHLCCTAFSWRQVRIRKINFHYVTPYIFTNSGNITECLHFFILSRHLFCIHYLLDLHFIHHLSLTFLLLVTQCLGRLLMESYLVHYYTHVEVELFCTHFSI